MKKNSFKIKKSTKHKKKKLYYVVAPDTHFIYETLHGTVYIQNYTNYPINIYF